MKNGTLLAVVFCCTTATAAVAAEVNIYTAREPKLIEPVLKAFTQDTGIKTNVVFVRDGLEERIRAEGANSPADVILQVDFSRLVQAKEMGITQPANSALLNFLTPAAYRDADGHWFASTLRARVIFASKERVNDMVLTYENLADPRWRGRICSRDGQNAYNTSLFAAMTARVGAEKAEAWLKGLRANLARKPSGGDRDVAKDIAAGQCDIGLANTYYLGLMLNQEPDRRPWAQAVRPILATFEGGGTHVNISGAALSRYAPNRAAALQLMEWMAGDRAQSLYARQNFEHPVRAGIELDPTVKAFGELKPDATPLVEIARHRKTASELVDKVNFNAGPGS
ncbi:MAG: Fe(3+) ABC transporter substrate-binding protein [Beijerinckiaceae bacterium]